MNDLKNYFDTELEFLQKLLKHEENDEDRRDLISHSIALINGATCFAMFTHVSTNDELMKVFEEYYNKFTALR